MALEEQCFRADVEVIGVGGSVLVGRSMHSEMWKGLRIRTDVTTVLSRP
jgi:hypothetical protein